MSKSFDADKDKIIFAKSRIQSGLGKEREKE